MDEGLDEGSVLAQPQFVAPQDDDYRLAEASPAWALGFEAIPRAQIGCYQADTRASWPVDMDEGVVREEPVLAHQPTRPIDEDFELEKAGQRPRNGDLMAPGTESSIRVTDETAASGEQSLKFVDAPNLRQVWLPRIYYGANLRDGQARLAFDLRLSGEAAPRLYVDPRQYTDSGGAEYFSGPKLDVRPDGTLIAAGQQIAKLPQDRWISLEMILTLGEGAPDATPLTITVAGEEPVTVQVPHGSEDFERLERVVFASIADQHAVFYVDNIVIGAVEE
jgi:hypothetical protein